jgi:asparagine synthase (glutamine-hydrolysing)
MCGIAGIIGRVSGANRAALERMTRALAHRGPDAERFWTGTPDADGVGCMLGFRRLSILDLSDCASQPMTDPKTGRVIVFNGEIYNYRTLRDELAAAGETFESSGDTAVLLRALAEWGPGRASRALRGMFAFGLWDDRERNLVLARDPLGIKPLYVCRSADPAAGWSMAFASEVRALLASGLPGKPRLNPAAVASVAWNGFVAGPDTAVAGVESLPPGELWTFDGRGRRQAAESYWSMPRALRDGTPSATEDDVRAALEESVRLHLVSDVPLGVFLSGGVDSGAVAHLAQKAAREKVDTFTLAFEEQAYNEGEHARAIAAAVGSNHHEVVLPESVFVAGLDEALDSLDQPTFDGLNSYAMSRAVHEAGLKVALVGTGGDELFGGYATFRDLPALLRWSGRTAWVPDGPKVAAARVVSALATRRQRNAAAAVAPQTRWAKLPDMVRGDGDLVTLYQLAYALFLPDFQRRLLRQDIATDGGMTSGLPPALRERLVNETAGRSALSAISVLEQRCFLGERLLRDSDAASMAVSLELRLPLVDVRVVETVNRLSDKDRYAPLGRKNVLRRVGLAGLDPALFDRPKSGFVLPYDQWIRRSLGTQMEETMCDARAAAAVGLDGPTVASLWQAYQAGAPGVYWSRVWALYVLIRWCHRHGVLL